MSPVLRQEELIDAVRAHCEQDPRVRAALQYGSFPKGEGDAYSDVEFYVYVADDQLAELDPAAWVGAVAHPLAFFTNEYGTRVAIFEDLVRGEFHFEPHSRVDRVASWRPVERPGARERMILLDRVGDLTTALGELRRRPLTPGDVQSVCDRFLNWCLLGVNVLKRGERARAAATLAFVQGFPLQLARASEGSVDHWLTPSRNLEHELPAEALERYAACHADLVPGALESAYRSAFGWGRELAAGLDGIDARSELGARLEARLGDWFPQRERW